MRYFLKRESIDRRYLIFVKRCSNTLYKWYIGMRLDFIKIDKKIWKGTSWEQFWKMLQMNRMREHIAFQILGACTQKAPSSVMWSLALVTTRSSLSADLSISCMTIYIHYEGKLEPSRVMLYTSRTLSWNECGQSKLLVNQPSCLILDNFKTTQQLWFHITEKVLQ